MGRRATTRKRAQAAKRPAFWLVETVRATVFAEDVNVLRLNDWDQIAGAPPARKTWTPQSGHSSVGSLPEQGGVTMIVNVQNQRADLILTAPAPQGESSDTLPDIGPLERSLDLLAEHCRAWLPTPRTDLARLAIGAILMHPAKDASHATQIILDWLPELKPQKPVYDLSVQMNLPRQSRIVRELKINRLVQWQTPIIATISVGLPTGPQGPITQRTVQVAQCTVDINTDPAVTHIGAQDVDTLLGECAELAVAIEQHGLKP